jgi:hypothetical protein
MKIKIDFARVFMIAILAVMVLFVAADMYTGGQVVDEVHAAVIANPSVVWTADPGKSQVKPIAQYRSALNVNTVSSGVANALGIPLEDIHTTCYLTNATQPTLDTATGIWTPGSQAGLAPADGAHIYIKGSTVSATGPFKILNSIVLTNSVTQFVSNTTELSEWVIVEVVSIVNAQSYVQCVVTARPAWD